MDGVQAGANTPTARMTAERLVNLSLYIGVIGLVSYIVGLGVPTWVIPTSTPWLICIFGAGIWIVASIISITLAANSLLRLESSSDPKKTRRIAIGIIMGNSATWVFTCALFAYFIKTLSEMD
jgi:type IV secretory pathway TrbD component